MNDAEYLFKQTSAERKRIGRGDHNKKRQGGKTIRFPSDHLTKKEREAMNGEIKTYDMARPVDWKTFKLWPEDLQRAYLLGLREQFNAYTTVVAQMMGVSTLTISSLQKKLGISMQSGGRHPELKRDAWDRFLQGTPEETPAPEPDPPTLPEPEPEPEQPEPEPEQPEEEETGIEGEFFSVRMIEVDADAFELAQALMTFKRLGIKCTIEVWP